MYKLYYSYARISIIKSQKTKTAASPVQFQIYILYNCIFIFWTIVILLWLKRTYLITKYILFCSKKFASSFEENTLKKKQWISYLFLIDKAFNDTYVSQASHSYLYMEALFLFIYGGSSFLFIYEGSIEFTFSNSFNVRFCGLMKHRTWISTAIKFLNKWNIYQCCVVKSKNIYFWTF